jgi:hypothetical protein
MQPQRPRNALKESSLQKALLLAVVDRTVLSFLGRGKRVVGLR